MSLRGNGFLFLPSEVIELILTFCAASEAPYSIAAVACTCTQLRALIYNAPDRHLWRALFLAAFDDPRRASQYTNDFDWQHGFTKRVRAARFISRSDDRDTADEAFKEFLLLRRSNEPLLDAISDRSFLTALVKAARTILSAIQTALPSAPRPLLPVTDPRTVQGFGLTDLHRQHSEASLFPPSLVSQSTSLNIEWLRSTLEQGLPANIVTLLFYDQFDERMWRSLPGARVLCEVTGCLGRISLNHLNSADRPSSAGPHTRSRESESDDTFPLSKYRAQPIAFNMQYLSRHRSWGPYLRVTEALLPTSQSDEDDSGDSDSDYLPPEDDRSSVATTPEPPDHPPPHVDGGGLTPEQLYPDWVWLAAGRVIAESTLREHVDDADIECLKTWDNLREGAWIQKRPDSSADPFSDASVDEEPAEPAEEWEKHQWDWAGAEGTWRRLVCWLGYDSLMYWNSRQQLPVWDGEEAWIIVPMSLRITGYSAPSLAAYPDRPTIHVKGAMGGAGWVGNVEPNEEDIRHVRGTVSMLPDGRVRWSMTSSVVNSTEDEWASEAVQLGGVGSAIGSLGMWTGAFHEDGDPLGVIWQWRVR